MVWKPGKSEFSNGTRHALMDVAWVGSSRCLDVSPPVCPKWGAPPSTFGGGVDRYAHAPTRLVETAGTGFTPSRGVCWLHGALGCRTTNDRTPNVTQWIVLNGMNSGRKRCRRSLRSCKIVPNEDPLAINALGIMLASLLLAPLLCQSAAARRRIDKRNYDHVFSPLSPPKLRRKLAIELRA